LIDANTLKAEFTGNFHEMWHYTGIMAMIDVAPTVDAVEVVPGHWVSLTDCSNAGVYCSVCNKKVYKEDYAWCNRKNKLRSNYCPNCGAKMDG
jgi:hypothetical protein